ncbi:hypothetical protein ABFU82_22205 [Nocardioides sp. WV_118_6]|uniref:hypothetical protein n=1 Tax=Nocardioides simplex TaxID=2045 RepID=UPI00215029CC|nr:hypothetical protein [Pimelobacter simplex]UUW91387.1 hypothetical protein M0M43_07830 [Pimelobacter simplex]UUW95215.1 hypothetical protein M0M48_26335 [Pimelobacter simplex]
MTPLRTAVLTTVTVLTTAVVGLTAPGEPATAAAPAAPAAATTDTDGDGLLDDWETDGYDADGDGVIDVDLPALGADPRHKDLFVELDWMPGLRPSVTVLDRVVQVFAAAPVDNPDGTAGIRIHLDGGAYPGRTTYDLGGAGQVPLDTNLSPYATEIRALRTAHFAPARAEIFRYMVWADRYNSGCSSGVALGIPSDTFVVTLGDTCGWARTDDQMVGTFVHELGHTLGLRHGGVDDTHYKPNYLSVMNYSFQLVGVPRTSGSSYFGYSDDAHPVLDERSLVESRGLGLGAVGWRTIWYCPGSGAARTSGDAAGGIDWSCNGTISTGGVRADINKNGRTGTLTAQDNWANLRFKGGTVGYGVAPANQAPPRRVEISPDVFRLVPPAALDELTKREADLLRRGQRPRTTP